MGRCAVSVGQGNHGRMMQCGGGVKEGGIGAGGDDSYSMRTRASIDDGGRRCPMAAMGPHSWLLSVEHTTINKHTIVAPDVCRS